MVWYVKYGLVCQVRFGMSSMVEWQVGELFGRRRSPLQQPAVNIEASRGLHLPPPIAQQLDYPFATFCSSATPLGPVPLSICHFISLPHLISASV